MYVPNATPNYIDKANNKKPSLYVLFDKEYNVMIVKIKRSLRCMLGIHDWYFISPGQVMCDRCGKLRK